MCFDRLTDEETLERGLSALLAAEWRYALRNGAMAGVIVVAALLFEGAPAWLTVGSAAGAVVLGALLHQAVLLIGWGVLRTTARWRADRAGTTT